jgi:AcrR family transcriptional regulator
VTDQTCGFQRARRPEQREARRQAILDAAAAMLAESSVTEISLRELSRRVGLAKSNVLRYFETREEVFLELLDRAAREWLADLAARLAEGGKENPVDRVAGVVADSLVDRPLLCELISVTAGVLERNISVDVARRFKLATADISVLLAGMVREHLPGLAEPAASQFVAAALVIVAGLWPFAHPTDAVRTAIEELGLDVPHLEFASMLRETLVNQLAGALARQPSDTSVR